MADREELLRLAERLDSASDYLRRSSTGHRDFREDAQHEACTAMADAADMLAALSAIGGGK